MKRLGPVAAVAVAAALLPALPAEAGHSRVLIISAPTLAWSDVAAHELPNIERLLAASAVANLSVRAIGSRTSLEEGYATIGAGNRARGAPGDEAGYAANADDEVGAGQAADVYEARMGVPPGPGAVLALNDAGLDRANATLPYGARVGALGDASVVTAVVANADAGPDADEPGEVFRPAVAAMADSTGQVDLGTVGTVLLEPAPRSPFGVRQSIEATTAAARKAWDGADLVLVEASDLARAERWRSTASPEGWRRARAGALTQADRLVGALAPLARPDRDLVLLVSPTAGGVEHLVVASARGPGMRAGSLLRSPTTRRAGYVTLTDIAPTALEHLGVEVPASMTGRAMRGRGPAAPLAQRVEHLTATDDAARFRDRWLAPFVLAFVVLHAVLAGAALVVLLRRDRCRAGRWLRLFALVLLGLPLATFLIGPAPVAALGAPATFGGLAAVSVVLAVAAEAAFSRVRLGPPMALATLTAVVLVGDVLTGQRLQINTLLGYSPIVAGRFQGLGNQAFAVLVTTTILVASWMATLLGWTRAAAAGVAVLFATALVAGGGPAFGSDVGGTLAATPAYGTAFLLLSGRRVDRRRILGLAAAALALVAAATVVDLLRPAAEQTHLGRLVQAAMDDPSRLATTLRRKVLANLGVLRTSIFTFLVPFLLACVGVLAFRPTSAMRQLLRAYPSLRPAVLATLVAAVLGLFLNDSGVAVPGLMLTVLSPVLVYGLLAIPLLPLPPEQARR